MSKRKIKHSAGPWRKCGGATPKYTAIADANNRYIVYSMATLEQVRERESKTDVVDDIDEQWANAQAMAAVPELIEALILGLEIAESGGSFSDLGRELGDEFKEKANHALKKAGCDE